MNRTYLVAFWRNQLVDDARIVVHLCFSLALLGRCSPAILGGLPSGLQKGLPLCRYDAEATLTGRSWQARDAGGTVQWLRHGKTMS
jgi:hypothetical protein